MEMTYISALLDHSFGLNFDAKLQVTIMKYDITHKAFFFQFLYLVYLVFVFLFVFYSSIESIEKDFKNQRMREKLSTAFHVLQMGIWKLIVRFFFAWLSSNWRFWVLIETSPVFYG